MSENTPLSDSEKIERYNKIHKKFHHVGISRCMGMSDIESEHEFFTFVKELFYPHADK
jgi:predicted N-formylglutamate amidohydrolase